MTERDGRWPAELREAARVSKAWPFEEARKLVARIERDGFDGTILFETGYGPSGLPHIGTFGEVARTSMVRHAFRLLTEDEVPTRLLCFSDDMDGLRKVPDNVPNREALAKDLGKPLTQVRDPFGEYESFGAGNNARLRAFLDRFGFDYEFASATDYYRSGIFDATLLKMLAVYEQVMAILLPTFGPERRATYSPFLPISEKGIVLQVPLSGIDVAAGTISYVNPDTGREVTTPVTGGRVKCQWKADWAMRWVALGVDYEMAGKDLIDSVTLSSKICRVLGGIPPEGFNYELFLDEAGQKISKSKGNGLTIDDWLAYASPESLSQFMFQKPRAAKRLYFDVIPRAVDDYYQSLDAYPRQDVAARLANPVWHIHDGAPPEMALPIPFSLLLNIASASNAEDDAILWGFISRHWPDTRREVLIKGHMDLVNRYAIGKDWWDHPKFARGPSYLGLDYWPPTPEFKAQREASLKHKVSVPKQVDDWGQAELECELEIRPDRSIHVAWRARLKEDDDDPWQKSGTVDVPPRQQPTDPAPRVVLDLVRSEMAWPVRAHIEFEILNDRAP